jgi:predicted transcriptional regulator
MRIIVADVSTRRRFSDVLASHLQEPGLRAMWEAQAPARALALRLTQYRSEHSLRQTDLARLLGVKQPAVARLATGVHTPTVATMLRIADALGIEILVDIKPRGATSSWVSIPDDRAHVVEKVVTASGSELLVLTS